MAPGPPDTRRKLLAEAAVLGAYVLAAVILTYPLITQATTHFPSGPNDKDVFTFLWNNWWIQHALTKLHTKPYFTDFILAPFLVDLRFHALGLLYGLLSVPAMLLVGPVTVLNAQVLGTIVLNGYATFKLTNHVAKNRGAAFLAGLLVATTPAITYHLVVGRPSYAAFWPGILAMVFSLRLLDHPDRRGSVFLALSLFAMLLSDQQATIFGGLWLAILMVHAAVTRRRELLRSGRWLAVAFAAGTLVPGYLLYYRPLRHAAEYTVPAATEALIYSYPLSLFWTPSVFWRVYGLLLPVALVTTLALARRVPSCRLWLAGSLIFLSLSLGPVAQGIGLGIPMPFSLLRKLPALAQFRTPYRFQSPAAIGLAIGFGVLVSWWVSRLGRRAGRLVLVAGVTLAMGDLLAHRLVYGFQTQTRPHDVVYREIARDSRDIMVLEIPVGVHCGTDRVGPGEELNVHQPVHGKRIINGLLARIPLAALAYYRASPALMFLAGETPPPGDVGTDLRRRIADLNVGYIVVHPEMMNRGWLDRTVTVLKEIEGLTPLQSDTGLIAFRVR